LSIAPAEPETRIERRGRAGWITLNRPKALNALTLTMVREISAALDSFEREAGCEFVVIVGAGERAFCAGGDVRKLHDQGRAGDHQSQRAFWREEYILNVRIKRYPKPFVAIIDGIVMGGGVGLAMHGSHRVVGDRAVFAMPEVGIGFFPDVGATYLLPRLPHHLGVFLALTGLNARAGDICALGLGTSFTTSGDLPSLSKALESDSAPLESILARFAVAPPASALMAEAEWIDSAFSTFDSGSIRDAVERAATSGSALARQAADALAKKSPTSQAIALRQMEIGGALEFEAAMTTEFRIVSRICLGHDFYEGVRAVIVEKDNAPRWRPAPGEKVDATAIDAYFAPLGPGEDLLFGAAR